MPRPPLLIRSLLVLLFGLCPTLFFTDLTRNPYYTQIALLNIFICLLWIVWLVQAFRREEAAWPLSPVDFPIAVLMGVCLVSWGWSAFIHAPLRSAIYSEGSKSAIFLLVNTWLVFSAAQKVQNRAFQKQLVWLTYAVSVGVSIYAMAQYFGQEWIWPKALNPYGSRPVATFGNPNFLSSYLVLVLPVLVGDYLFKCTGVPRVILLGGILCNVGALISTLTRSSWGGLGVALLVLFAFVGRSDRLRKEAGQWLVLLLISMGLMGAFWPRSQSAAYSETVLGRISEVKTFRESNYGPVWQRALIWTSAWGMVQDHPILGKGWGNFELFYPFYQGAVLLEPRFKTLRTHANNAHNEILEYWSQIGTVGLGIVFWLWAVFFRAARSVNSRLEEAWKPVQAGMTAGVAGMLADNLLNVSVHFAVPAFMFWWWVGSAMALDPAPLPTHTISLKSPVRKGLLVLVGLGLMLLIARSAAMWMMEVNFFEGFKRSKGGDLMGARRALEKAHAWHPLEVNNNYELANVLARLSYRDEAVRMYQRAIDANAGYDEIYFNRATIYLQMGREDLAEANYRLAMAINPLSREAYNALAGIYAKDVKRYGAVMEQLYARALQAFPLDKDLWNNLGWVYTQEGQWEKARDAYQHALAIDPTFDLANRNLAAVMPHVKVKR